MRKNQALSVMVHNVDSDAISRIVNEFHVQVIERRLTRLPLTTAQKIVVLDKIIKNLKLREDNGMIQ